MTEQFHLGTAMTVSDTQLQTARVSYVTYSRNQLCQLAGWGYGETRGQARCSNITVFCKLIFSDFKKMAGTCSVFDCKGAKGELVSPHLLPKDLKTRQDFSEHCFCHKTYIKTHNTVHPFILGTRRSTSKFIFLVFYLLTVSKQICSVLDDVSPPSWMMINFKCKQDILNGLGVLTKKVTANITKTVCQIAKLLN